MAGPAALSATVDASALKGLMRVVRGEADSKTLRKDLRSALIEAVKPGVSAVQSQLRSIPHAGATRSAPALGSYLAARTKSQVKLGGRSSGVYIKVAQTPNIRGFKLAARRLNAKSWRHRVYGSGRWVTQTSPIPGFFDDTLAKGADEYRAAVITALGDLADRLTRRKYIPGAK